MEKTAISFLSIFASIVKLFEQHRINPFDVIIGISHAPSTW